MKLVSATIIILVITCISIYYLIRKKINKSRQRIFVIDLTLNKPQVRLCTIIDKFENHVKVFCPAYDKYMDVTFKNNNFYFDDQLDKLDEVINSIRKQKLDELSTTPTN